jgi:hypothetical protein
VSAVGILFARDGPMLAKYVLNSSAISDELVKIFPFTIRDLTDVFLVLLF